MPTTAQKIIAFKQELDAAGIKSDLVADHVRDACQTLVLHHGLIVSPPGGVGDTSPKGLGLDKTPSPQG
jgi:hypothetical protein